MGINGKKIVNLEDLKISHNNLNEKIDRLIEDNMLLDGTIEQYKAVMRWFFLNNGVNAMTETGMTELCDKWYEQTSGTWNGCTTFRQPDNSAASDGIKGGDNEGLICIASTNTEAGRDDYAGNTLFACIDCNYTVDADTMEPVITAIDGITSGFTRTDPTKYVGVLQQSGWHWYDEEEETYTHGYSSVYQSGHDYCEPLPEAVRASDNSMRPWVVHSKYMSHTENGKLTGYSGPIPSSMISHNTLHTLSKETGAQYSGGCVIDYAFLQLMAFIKYGKMTLDGTLQGCVNYNYQYYAKVAEAGVKRVLLNPTEAANLIVGSGVLIGAYNGTTKDRGDKSAYSITGIDGAKITTIESVIVNGKEYTAVTVDTEDTFDTVANGNEVAGTTMISTYHWPNGSCDNIRGNDGSPAEPGSGKYPARLQGIEYSVGGREVMADVILNLYQDGDSYYYEPNIVNKTANQATGITENYKPTGLKSMQATESDAWQYIRKLGFAKGIFFGTDTSGGSSSTYTRDAFYKNTNKAGTREWLAFGDLSSGAGLGGLSHLAGYYELSTAYWAFLARLSPNGNRGEWAA